MADINTSRRAPWITAAVAIAIIAIVAALVYRQNQSKDNNDINVDIGNNTAPNSDNQTPVTPASPTLTATAKTFKSDKLGIQFTYESKPVTGGETEVTATEIGNKVYLHTTKEKPEQGKSIEVLTKDPVLTFKQAIEQMFLKNYSPQNCYVEEVPQDPRDTRPDNYMFAGISYPAPTEPGAPFWQNNNKCPKTYSKTNDVRYFMFNPDVPNKFTFVILGQDSITTDGVVYAKVEDSQDWSGSIRIVK